MKTFLRHAVSSAALMWTLAAGIGHCGENWGQWRGPAFNGSSTETGLPSEWGPEKNLIWRVAMPGASQATPVVWDDHVYCTAVGTGNEILGLCLKRSDGSVLWKYKIGEVKATTPQSKTGKNTMASPSPATDGKHVAMMSGTGELHLLNNEGSLLWSKDIEKEYGTLVFMHGYSSSPLIYKNRVYVQVLRRDRAEVGQKVEDKDFSSWLLAFDLETGKEVFKAVRKTDATDGACEAYTSPVPYTTPAPARDEILISGADRVTSHNPDTGEELWHWGTLAPWKTGNVRCVGSPTPTEWGVLAAGPKQRPLFMIKPGGSGDISKTHKAWEYKDLPCAVPSALLYKGDVYSLDGFKRTLAKLNPATGEVKGTCSLGGMADFDASPAAADGKIFCMSEFGTVFIIDAEKMTILSKVDLEEGISAASIAVGQGAFFVRTAKALYCIGAPNVPR